MRVYVATDVQAVPAAAAVRTLVREVRIRSQDEQLAAPTPARGLTS